MVNLKLKFELSSYFSQYNMEKLKENPETFDLWCLDTNSFTRDMVWKNNTYSIWLHFNPMASTLEIQHNHKDILTKYDDLEDITIEDIVKIIENELKN